MTKLLNTGVWSYKSCYLPKLAVVHNIQNIFKCARMSVKPTFTHHTEKEDINVKVHV